MENEINFDRAELFSNSARGIYIPQHFAESVKREMVQNITQEQWEILEKGPDSCDWYWDTWAEVLDNAVLNHPTLGECSLWQDGDLWIIVDADQGLNNV